MFTEVRIINLVHFSIRRYYMSDFKNLNLDREKLEDNIKDFINSCGHVIDGELQSNSKKIRVVFGPPGETFATVDFFLNKEKL